MLSITPSTVVIVPILAIVSVPLLLSAYITTLCALLALCARLLVIYVELCSAIVASYFSIPTSSDSLLTFTPSEPSTPDVLSSSLTSAVDFVTYTPAQSASPPSARRQARPLQRRRSSSASQDNTWFPRRGKLSSMAGSTSFSSFMSGDEHRDFEDMGGWRCSGACASNRGLLSRSVSSKPICETADDRAWLSINQHLELPSHSRRLSFTESGVPESFVRVAPGRRNHRRSVTTSVLNFPAVRHRPPPPASLSRSCSPSTFPTQLSQTRRASRPDLADTSQGSLEGSSADQLENLCTE